ncbi:MAG: ABC transporter substrate-binding protein [Proteobacteria bacterium]|nr:ABC transporter substrate-binding protein [Pseudomonadota bacterium]
MKTTSLLRTGVACAALLTAALAAQAETSLKVAGLRTISLLPIEYAAKQGYFKREGVDVEVLTVNAGPAVISAVASGSAQIGYTASVPVLFARAQGQPVRIFDAFTYETAKPEGQWTWLVASEKSGIKSVKDLAGKTLAMNASGALCELQFREHMAKAGVSFDAAKKIVVPFPQMQAALQLGNADAACVVEPFRTNMKVSPEIKAVTIASGTLAGNAQRYTLDVLFAREDWGQANQDALRRFNRGLLAAFADFKRDPTLFRRLITEGFKLSPAVVSLMKSDLDFTDLQPSAADTKPLIDGLQQQGLLKTPLRPDDVILQVK